MAAREHELLTLMRDIGVAAVELVHTKVRVSDSIADLDAFLASRPGEAVFAVLGRTGAGKSSLINALLDQPDLLPTGRRTTTNCRVRISYASEPRARLVFRSGAEREIDIRRLSDFVCVPPTPTSVPQLPEGELDYVDLQVPSALLEQGIVLDDTTGAYGVMADHTDRAFAAALGTTGVIIASEAVRPAGDQELKLFARVTQGLTETGAAALAVITVLTKADLVNAQTLASVTANLQRRVGTATGIDKPTLYQVDSRFQDGRLRNPHTIVALRSELTRLGPQDRYLIAALGRSGFQIQTLRARVVERIARLQTPLTRADREAARPRTRRLEERREKLKNEIAERIAEARYLVDVRVTEFRNGESSAGGLAVRDVAEKISQGASDQQAASMVETHLEKFSKELSREVIQEIFNNLDKIDDEDLRALLTERRDLLDHQPKATGPARAATDWYAALSKFAADQSRSIWIVFTIRGVLTPFTGPGFAWAAGGAAHALIQSHLAAEDRRRRGATAHQQAAPLLNAGLGQIQQDFNVLLRTIVERSRAAVDELISAERHAYLQDEALDVATDVEAAAQRDQELAVLRQALHRLDHLDQRWNELRQIPR
ncbi:dynamin family protein [Dactylosporangium sp. NPDC049525]|uniref:dynamin family protein n=1 Tax=Dactylosporangium sp. NPDC049525 TaxID=3154730 RepID=UPI00342FEE11